MELLALATALPPHACTQAACWEQFTRSPSYRALSPRALELAEKVITGPSGIETRHFVTAEIDSLFDLDAEGLNALFEREAPALGTAALTKALERAQLQPGQLDALVVCTCTGYLCPGPSSFIAERAGLRGDAGLYDLVGLGCGAAIPALRTASGLLAAEPGATVAVIALEVCSAAFFLDEDPGVIISACLFGDGAAATLWRSGADSGAGTEDRWAAQGFAALHRPEHRALLRFENSGGKLRNRLHVTVPRRAGLAVEELFQRTYPAATARGPDAVIAHPGGRDVLTALRGVLPGHPLDESAAVLRRCGNMSSPSVLFALEERLEQSLPGDRELWLTSFGAGFSAHSCRLSRG